jgi:hypothetical protein
MTIVIVVLDALIYWRVRAIYFYSWGDANEERGMSVKEMYVLRNNMAQIRRQQ